MILEIDEERRRISLGMKQCMPNPWDEFSRNHKKGEKVHVPEKRVPHFKAGKELRERVDARRPESTIVRAVEAAQLRGGESEVKS